VVYAVVFYKENKGTVSYDLKNLSKLHCSQCVLEIPLLDFLINTNPNAKKRIKHYHFLTTLVDYLDPVLVRPTGP
jgi:hypothetical protein